MKKEKDFYQLEKEIILLKERIDELLLSEDPGARNKIPPLKQKIEKEWEKIPHTYLKHIKDAFAELEKKNPDKVADEFEVNRELSPEAVKIAIERTFEGWTDKDWQALEDAWADFTG